MRTALVIGATGLVGSHLVKVLAENKRYDKVKLLLRRPLGLKHPKIEECVFDFDKPDESEVAADDIFCAIGTTLKKAGSKEKQQLIDCTYPLRIAEIGAKKGAKQFILVSSLGANARSSNFYLRTKGELEDSLRLLPYRSLIILRPSIILGKRTEFRLGERIGIALFGLMEPFMLGPLRKYRGVQASSIARTMLATAIQDREGLQIMESDQIHD